jgi:hypothetical protein
MNVIVAGSFAKRRGYHGRGSGAGIRRQVTGRFSPAESAELVTRGIVIINADVYPR